jgi:ABC-2 type transport system ATP-binding protein
VKKPNDTAINISNVSKSFKLPLERNNTIKSIFVNPFRKRGHKNQEVLKNISLEVKKGEFFGIVGRNGSGKSTLLKMIAGVYSPTSGGITVKGKLVPFIELGVGFNEELTGRENIYLNGALLGFSRKEMDSKYEEIVEFSELRQFMDQKLKNYSSGMQVRLAFAVAVQADSEILLLDEVLAVGDVSFQQKCFDYFKKIKGNKTVILISHDLGSVERFCDRVVILEKGHLIDEGNASDMVFNYGLLMSNPNLKLDSISKEDGSVRLGNGEARIIKTELNEDIKTLKQYENFSVCIKYETKSKIYDPAFLVTIFDKENVKLISVNTKQDKFHIENIDKNGKIIVDFPDNQLAPGTYKINVGIFSSDNTEPYDHVRNALQFKIIPEKKDEKIIANQKIVPKHTWQIKK